MGNSEVGHNALGAGRVVQQGASLVDDALKSGAMFEGSAWHYLVDPLVKSGKTLHMIGLLSDGGVHSRYVVVVTRDTGGLSTSSYLVSTRWSL